MSGFDDIVREATRMAKENVTAIPAERRQRVSAADAVYHAVMSAATEAVPRGVDADWCVVMLKDRPQLLERRIGGGGIVFVEMFRNVVIDEVCDAAERVIDAMHEEMAGHGVVRNDDELAALQQAIAAENAAPAP